ncbi:ComEC/Rec2 family competence protein, partial [bacterium]|nr:ComEC/Rec2 family competence protein [bacterium]
MLDLRSRVPALVAALAIALGVGLAGFFGTGSGVRVAVVGLLAPAGLLLCLPAAVNVVGGRPARALLADVALLCALVAAGCAHYETSHRALPSDHIALRKAGAVVAVRARVAETRRTSSDHTNVVIEVLGLIDPLGPGVPDAPARGLIWARWPDGATRPARGDVVVISGELNVPSRRRNPGAFDFASYLRNRRIHRTLRHCELLEFERPERRLDVSGWIYRTLPERVPGVPGEVLRGLLLGTGRELPDELTEAFRRAGTVHVLAVSGLHVGFIVLIVHAVLRSLRVPRKLSRLLVLPALVGFVLIVGPRPSVVRASTMAAFLIAAPLLERRPNPLNALGAAGLALLLVRPGSLFDLGFRLSFSAVAGILLLHRPLENALSVPLRALGHWAVRFAAPIALSLSAQTGVATILVGVFGEASVVSPAANLAVVPLAGLSVAAGIAMLACEPLGSWPASAFAAVAWSSIQLLVWITERLGDCPWATVRVASRFWPAVLCATTGLTLRVTATSVRARRVGAGVMLASAVVAATLFLTGPGRSYARIVFFDVGQGDSILLELPRRQYALIDAGPGPTSAEQVGMRGVRDAGADVVLRHLRREGIARLAFLVVTHAHADHYGGATSVLLGVRVDTLILPVGRTADPRLANLIVVARRRGTGIREVSWGETLRVGNVLLTVLWPDPTVTAEWSENNC